MTSERFNRRPLFHLFPILLIAGCSLFEQGPAPISWAEEDLSGMVLYTYAHSTDELVVVDLVSGEILKTLTGFERIQSIQTNVSGSRLYVSMTKTDSDTGPGVIYEVNTQTWERREIYGKSAHLLTNRNGGVFFITKQSDPVTGFAVPDRMFGKIDPSDGEVTELDSIQVTHSISIHPTKPLVYAIDGTSGTYEYDYELHRIRYLSEKELSKGTLPLWWMGGKAARRDLREVYRTDPRDYQYGTHSGYITVISPSQNNKTIGKIQTFIDGNPSPTDDMYLTPLERYGIVNADRRAYFIIDLKERKVIHTHQFVKDGSRTLSMERIHLAARPIGL